jgi:aminoglycoside phosphotransferase (APT) family kinase protein
VLHDARPSELPPTGAGARDAHAEIAATLRAAEHIVVLLPDVGAGLLALVDEIAAELDQLPAEEPTFTHGDLKSDNVLASPDGVRLLDLDRCGLADPALDLAKFVADLRWWSAADEDRASSLIDAFRSGYGAPDAARWDRAMPLARLFQLKLAARRCAVHDPSWESDVRARVSAATPVLAAGA